MYNINMTARNASYILFAVLVVAIISLHMGNCVLAGLFSYTILDAAHRQISKRVPPPWARGLSLAAFFIVATILCWIFVLFLRRGLADFPNILSAALPKLKELTDHYGLDLPLENVNELRKAGLDIFKENLHAVTRASGLLTAGFFHVIIGIFGAVLAFMSDAPEPGGNDLYESLRREFNERMGRFMRGFEKVFGAQVLISVINTLLTAVFLLVMGFSYIEFLIPATFILGTLPIIGNVISNAIIVGTGLTISPRHAAFALAFLVFIHKGEYILNSRIIGSAVKSPMWQTLLAILVGETIFGVPGIVLAPAMLHYLREELKALPAS